MRSLVGPRAGDLPKHLLQRQGVVAGLIEPIEGPNPTGGVRDTGPCGDAHDIRVIASRVVEQGPRGPSATLRWVKIVGQRWVSLDGHQHRAHEQRPPSMRSLLPRYTAARSVLEA